MDYDFLFFAGKIKPTRRVTERVCVRLDPTGCVRLWTHLALDAIQ